MKRLNRETFFAELKKELFPDRFAGKGGADQIKGIDILIDEWEKRPDVPRPFFANIMATTMHETGRTMQPVRETFAKTDKTAMARLERAFNAGQLSWVKTPYWRDGFFGRGYVQLTHKYNYEKAGKKLGIDLVSNPNLALKPEYAVKILFDGMLEGWFTGKALKDYIDDVMETDAEDFKEQKNARKVVNGTDRDKEIADIALKLDRAMYKAEITNTSPIEKSNTIPLNVGVGTGGAAILVEPINDLIKKLQTNIDVFQWDDVVKLVIGLVVIGGALFTIYARWDSAGRPNIFGGLFPKWGNK